MLQLLALPISPHGSSSLMKKQIEEICTRRVDELQSKVGLGFYSGLNVLMLLLAVRL